MKVLCIVEDEDDILFLERTMLTVDPRIEIVGEAKSAEEAIEICRKTQPGLIILDHMLEGELTGLEAAPLLKEAAPQAKILMFTGLDVGGKARNVPEIDEYLAKTDIARFVATVQRLLGLT